MPDSRGRQPFHPQYHELLFLGGVFGLGVLITLGWLVLGDVLNSLFG
jgi:hypothetical protein